MSDPTRSPAEVLLDHRFDLCLSGALLAQLAGGVWAVTMVLPQFRSIFQSMNVELPWVTELLLGLSNLTEAYWFLVLPLMGAVVATVAGLVPILWVQRAEAAPDPKSRKLAELGLSLYLIGANLAVAAFSGLATLAIYMPMIKLINNVG